MKIERHEVSHEHFIGQCDVASSPAGAMIFVYGLSRRRACDFKHTLTSSVGGYPPSSNLGPNWTSAIIEGSIDKPRDHTFPPGDLFLLRLTHEIVPFVGPPYDFVTSILGPLISMSIEYIDPIKTRVVQLAILQLKACEKKLYVDRQNTSTKELRLALVPPWPLGSGNLDHAAFGQPLHAWQRNLETFLEVCSH